MAYTKVQLINCLYLVPGFILPVTVNADALDDLISAAITSHPSIQSQISMEKAAGAAVDNAEWQFFPTPGYEVEAVRTPGSDNANESEDYVATLSLQQPIWTGGKLTAGVEKAKAAALTTQANTDATRHEVALRVVQAYGDWLSAFHKRKARLESVEKHENLRDQVSRRVKSGFSSKSDLLLAKARLETSKADFSSAQMEETESLSRLSQLVGHSVKTRDLSQDISSAKIISSDLQNLLVNAEKVSPDVRKALLNITSADANIEEKKSSLYPEVYLRLERQFGTYSGQDIESENRIFFGLSSNFGAGFSNFSNVNQAREVRRSALAEADSVKREVSERVMSDFALAQSLEHRVDSLSRSLETAKSVATSYSRQFLSGKKTWLDVMNSNRDLTQTEVQYAESLGSLLTVTWRLSIMSSGLSADNDYRTIDSDDGFNRRDREDVKVMVSQVGDKDVIDPLSMDYQAVNYSLSRDRDMVSKWDAQSDKYHVREKSNRKIAKKRHDSFDKEVTNTRQSNARSNATAFVDPGKNSTRKKKGVVQTSYVSLITTEK